MIKINKIVSVLLIILILATSAIATASSITARTAIQDICNPGVVPPTISSVVGRIFPSSLGWSITINGTCFGDVFPSVYTYGDGSVTTQPNTTSPAIILVNQGSTGTVFNWGAGFGGDVIGIYLASWTNNEIKINGFGPLSYPFGTYKIAPGDQIFIYMIGPNCEASTNPQWPTLSHPPLSTWPSNCFAFSSTTVAMPDTTLPIITLDGDNPTTVYLGSIYTDPGATAIDETDGSVPIITTGSVDTNVIGIYNITYKAVDKAGNSASTTRNVKVIYNFAGFFQPIDAIPALNAVKAGGAVPVKFSLNGNQGLNILMSGYPLSKRIDCASNVPIDDIETTVTAGQSSLSYDGANNQYSYVWKTDKTWANTCRQLIIKMKDDTEHFANFKFK